jgi:hypothetical protein
VNKIPVGDTIAHAYKFTFENLGAIIGLIWLPTILNAVGTFFAQTYYSATVTAAMMQTRPAEAGQAALSMIAWSLLSLLLTAIIVGAVTRQALGLRKGPAFIHFSLGQQEFRIFGAELALGAILALFVMFYFIGVVTLAGLAMKSAARPLAIVAVLAALGGGCAIFYVMVRLSFLLFPATVAENKLGLSRSWTLTRGNFWRIVAIGLATVGPLVVVVLVGEYVILGPGYFQLLFSAVSADAATQAKMSDMQSSMMSAHMPAILGLSLLMAPFNAGLALGAASFAYRVVTPAKPVL